MDDPVNTYTPRITHCISCGYNLSGSDSSLCCPECGLVLGRDPVVVPIEVFQQNARGLRVILWWVVVVSAALAILAILAVVEGARREAILALSIIPVMAICVYAASKSAGVMPQNETDCTPHIAVLEAGVLVCPSGRYREGSLHAWDGLIKEAGQAARFDEILAQREGAWFGRLPVPFRRDLNRTISAWLARQGTSEKAKTAGIDALAGESE